MDSRILDDRHGTFDSTCMYTFLMHELVTWVPHDSLERSPLCYLAGHDHADSGVSRSYWNWHWSHKE